MKLKIACVTVLIATIMIPSAFADSIPVEIDGTAYEIDYASTNVIIKSVTADLDFISLIFETEVSDSSNDVSISFQRDFFDAKIGYSDDDFFILSDGDEIEFEETKTDESRTISFSLLQGTEEIEIIGTILADNSFLKDQLDAQAEAEAAAQAEAESTAQTEAEAAAQAEAESVAQAESEAAAQAEIAEEENLEKLVNACGDGTVFENGECVLSALEKNATNVSYGHLIYSTVIGMSMGIIIMLILWGIGKKSHKVLSDEPSMIDS